MRFWLLNLIVAVCEADVCCKGNFVCNGCGEGSGEKGNLGVDF